MVKNVPLSPGEKEELFRLVEETGETAAYELLGANRATVARALAGLPVRGATLIALRLVLKKRRNRKESRAAKKADHG